jgi:hypothetical protein
VPRYSRARVVHGFWDRLCLEVDSRATKKKNESSEYVDKAGTHMRNMCWTSLLVSQCFFSQHVKPRMHKC